jgi:hypothetical protein
MVVEIEGLEPAALESESGGYFSLLSLPDGSNYRVLR